MKKLLNLDAFRLIGWAIVIINGGQAVNGVITGSYLYAGCMIAIGVAWIGLLEFSE